MFDRWWNIYLFDNMETIMEQYFILPEEDSLVDENISLKNAVDNLRRLLLKLR